MPRKRACLELVHMWMEIDDAEVNSWSPLKDVIGTFVEVRNTGETTVERFVWKQESDIGHMKMDLLHPKIPATVWRPFGGSLLSSVWMREISFKEGEVFSRNVVLDRAEEVIVRTPVLNGGLKPGESIVIGEKSLYFRYIEDHIVAKGLELKTETEVRIVDAEEGVARAMIKQFKFGPISFSNVKAEAVLMGGFQVTNEILMDSDVVDRYEERFEFV